MAGRIIAIVILILTLALIYLAPQGLLTKPTLEQGLRGPFELRDLVSVDETTAYRTAYDSGVHMLTHPEEWLPAVVNERMISGTDAPLQVGIAKEMVRAASQTRDDSSAVTRWPRDTYLVAKFPNRGQFSARLGAWKVYKGFQHEIMKRQYLPGPVLEIHDLSSEEIVYFMPVIVRDTQE